MRAGWAHISTYSLAIVSYGTFGGTADRQCSVRKAVHSSTNAEAPSQDRSAAMLFSGCRAGLLGSANHWRDGSSESGAWQ
jgi:hypothetical protein